jgi:chromosome segregation ATPase
MNLQEFARLKDELESLKRRAARAQGALEQLKARLREEFGIGTLKAARTLLGELEAERADLEKRYAAGRAAFREEYGDLLSG